MLLRRYQFALQRGITCKGWLCLTEGDRNFIYVHFRYKYIITFSILNQKVYLSLKKQSSKNGLQLFSQFGSASSKDKFMLYVIAVLSLYLQLAVVVTAWSQDILVNGFKLPVINLCQKYSLLLDTGSKDTWIADSSCQNCPQKASICPQSHSISHQIKYFKGSIKGDIAFLATCLGSYKIICGTQAQGMQAVGAMGILGLRGSGTGKAIIKTILQSHNVKQHSFAFYYGLKENLIFFGDVPTSFIKEQLQLSNGQKQWQIKQSNMTVWGKQTTQQTFHQLYIDTGSNVLILPLQIYQEVRTIINTEMSKLGCLTLEESFQYLCASYIILKGTMVFQLSGKSLLEFGLDKTLILKDGRHKLLIESRNEEGMVIGGSLLRDYIILFNLDGAIKIYQSNSNELHSKEINNFKIIFAQYMAIVIVLAFASTKLYQIIQLTLNRKIVI